MTHLKAKSVADYGQKKFEEKVQKTLDEGAKKISAAVERAEKYPMCTKLSESSDERRTINDFVEWLQQKGIWLCDREEGSNFAEYRPIAKRSDELVMEYLEIDTKKLEEERRAILAEQRRANGDAEGDD